MGIRIALAGNPNCGKTTMFNALTGSNQYVGNWPGVTVEKKEGKYTANKEVEITDLPGIYSLSPYSPEEIVSRNFLIDERPDVVINLVDATNLERNLYLTTQLVDLGLPVVIALNMMDVIEKTGDTINVTRLSEELGCPVCETSALRGRGLTELMDCAIATAEAKKPASPRLSFGASLLGAISEVSELIKDKVPAELSRWYSIKLLEEDTKTLEKLELPEDLVVQINTIGKKLVDEFDDDIESIVAGERYNLIAQISQDVFVRKQQGLTPTQKIDRIVTNRWLGLPIFALIMFLVYFISVSTAGKLLTDWTNDGVVGDGWLYTGQEEFAAAEEEYGGYKEQIEAYLEAAREKGVDTEAFEAARAAEEPTQEDEETIDNFMKEVEEKNIVAEVKTEEGEESVDFKAFEEACSKEEPDPNDYGVYIEGITPRLDKFLEDAGCVDWLRSLIVNGIVAGVGAVLGFVPQLIILFILLSALEACGYLARVAFIMDRIFRRFGLSGKSFIPMLIASGCGVPAIMATKTIENERDRRMTIMTTTMIPCSAKLPIIALVFGALSGNNSEETWWVAPCFYFLGVFAIIISGIMLKKTKFFAGEASPFVMELPRYHVPSIKGVLLSTWERVRGYIIKAGTIIFLSSIVIWFLMNLGFVDGSFGLIDPEAPGEINNSLMAGLGTAIAGIFAPLGFGEWQATVTSICALVAKENAVATVGILTQLGDAEAVDPNMWAAFAAMFNGSAAAVAAFCAFNLLCAPCFAAIGSIRRNMESAKWTWFAIIYMTLFAWVVGFLIYQFLGLALGTVEFNFWTVVAIVLLGGILFQIFRPMPKVEDNTEAAAE